MVFLNIFLRCLFSIFRMLIIGGSVVLLLIFQIDSFTNPEYGTNNLVLIASSFAFFPIFAALFVEFMLFFIRKERKKKKKINESLQHQKG